MTCTPQAIADSAPCWDCIPVQLREPAIIYLLNVINGMQLTPQQIADGAKCYDCIPKQLRLPAMLYLLCAIANGSGGFGGVDCGLVDPTVPPVGNCGFYTNTVTGGVWYWDAPNTTWQSLIVGI